MQSDDVTLRVLMEIRDRIGETNQRIDQKGSQSLERCERDIDVLKHQVG